MMRRALGVFFRGGQLEVLSYTTLTLTLALGKTKEDIFQLDRETQTLQQTKL